MKKTVLTLCCLCIITLAISQQKEGKVIYARTMQMQINIAGGDEALQHAMPRTRTDKFELSYGNNKSLLQHVEDEVSSDEAVGNGIQIRMVTAGANDIVFYDFSNGARLEQREIFDKKFLVNDTIARLNWKLTGQTKNILSYTCQQATAQRIGSRLQTTMENGKLERKEITDTSNLTAWFAPDIAIPAGPDVPGQLPGLILALDVNNGRVVYQALDISPKVNTAVIVAPVKGKKVTAAEFRTERDKMFQEMQKNNSGRGNQVIRIQN